MRYIIIGLFFVFCGCSNTAYQKTIQQNQQYEKNLEEFKKSLTPVQVKNLTTFRSDYKKKIEAKIKENLKDPDSAKFRYDEEPLLCHFSYHDDNSTKPGIGRCGKVWVNAKNSFGGYTGYKSDVYIISNGIVWYLFGAHGNLYPAHMGIMDKL